MENPLEIPEKNNVDGEPDAKKPKIEEKKQSCRAKRGQNKVIY